MRSLALGTLLAAGLCGHAARAAQADPRSHEAAKVDSGVPFAEAVAGRGAPEAVAAPAGAPGSRPSAFAQLSGGAGRDGARPEIPPPAQDTPVDAASAALEDWLKGLLGEEWSEPRFLVMLLPITLGLLFMASWRFAALIPVLKAVLVGLAASTVAGGAAGLALGALSHAAWLLYRTRREGRYPGDAGSPIGGVVLAGLSGAVFGGTLPWTLASVVAVGGLAALAAVACAVARAVAEEGRGLASLAGRTFGRVDDGLKRLLERLAGSPGEVSPPAGA